MKQQQQKRINAEISKVATLKEKLCVAQIAINKDRYFQISNMVLHDGEYITQDELFYLETPTQDNWVRAMQSLNNNFVNNGVSAWTTPLPASTS